MQQTEIQTAAQMLLTRRLMGRFSDSLEPEYRPQSVAEALLIQQYLIVLMAQQGDDVGGWKCALPIAVDGLTEVPVIAPIFSRTLYAASPCPIIADAGRLKIEPEIAFCFAEDLPARQAPYSEKEIIMALSGAHLVLELILSRYLDPDSVSYLEHLADCLFNQGLFIGPEITLEQAFQATEIDFKLVASFVAFGEQRIAGKHPCGFPQRPLFWLVNFLREQGIDIKAGQQIITSSYAGVLDVEPDEDIRLVYGQLGEIVLRFETLEFD